jgi:DNA-directed RNA polymerase subunit RPC12/RpoP
MHRRESLNVLRRITMARKIRNIIKYRRYAVISLFVSLPMSFIGTLSKSRALSVAGPALLMAFIIVSLILWRCPNCKKRLPFRFDGDNEIDDVYICPHCNARFSDEGTID